MAIIGLLYSRHNSLNVKSILRAIYYWGLAKPEDFQAAQRLIRNTEWSDVSKFIPKGSRFLDIGCGTGYSMTKALTELDCSCVGVDPFPNYAGVEIDRSKYPEERFQILEGWAEKLPLDDNSVDVVYSSHMLEHTNDEQASLEEMKRVLKPGGTMILGVPTASMSIVRLFTMLLFDTHRNIFNILFWPFREAGFKKEKKFIDFVRPNSHGQPGKSIFFDLNHYRVKNWRRLISSVFRVEKELYPGFYCYPDYYQIFKMRKLETVSSSVFFVCKVD